ncbi:hypothetical protein [Cupriavidus basilensis]
MEIDLNDPEQAYKAFMAAESGSATESPNGGVVAPDKDAEAKAAQEAAEAAAAAKEAEEAAAAAKAAEAAKVDTQQANNESNAEGVLARDGKNIIPFSVLRTERERAARAEQLAKEFAEKIAALEARLAAGNQGAKTGEGARTTEAAAEVVAMTPEELESFKEDFPTQYKVYMAQQATIQALKDKLQPVEEDLAKQQEEQRVAVETMVNDAIDATPKLAHIRATDKELYAAAQQFDAVLRTQPKWAGKTLAERFARVVELVESEHGAIEIPGATPVTLQKTPEQLKKEAEALASKTAAKPAPNSLSDFPAGDPPAQSETDALETMTHAQLADKFAKMSPDQLDAYFNSI